MDHGTQDKIRLLFICNHFRCEIVRETGIAQFFNFNLAATLRSSVLFEKLLESRAKSSTGDAIASQGIARCDEPG